ncbi:hypothetical protein KR032_000394 [Drosophila birchii]|nr:hypothetical protein KR032_000394 [Drosophila birchii]
MSNQVPCLLFLFVIAILVLSFGCYYTYMYKKDYYLESCYHLGGKCLEEENCELSHQYRQKATTCVHKRKVCCMSERQLILNVDDY